MAKNSPPLPWFKCYQDAWLDGTRDLPPDQRGIYFDCLCLMYKYDGPLRDDDKWIAHKLHVSIKLWKSIRKALVSCGKLVETEAGLVNERAAIEVVERASLRESRSEIAHERAEKRRIEPRFPFDIKGRGTTGVVSRARASSDHQSQDTEKKEKEAVGLNASLEEEERKRPRRVIPKSTRDELIGVVGAERAIELMDEYLDSDMATNAKAISSAFRGWLRKLHGVHLPSPKDNVFVLNDFLESLPKDKYGKPDTSLPKVVTRNVKWKGR